jgi:hypothetical protein
VHQCWWLGASTSSQFQGEAHHYRMNTGKRTTGLAFIDEQRRLDI